MSDFLRTGTTLLASAEGGEHGPSFLGLGIYIGLVLLIVFVTMSMAKKGLGKRVFSNIWAKLYEQLYLFIENMCVGTIGSHGRKYIPMIMTFWLMIFVGSFVALFFPTSPTADIGFNLGMALIAVFYVQHEGISGHYVAERAKGRDPISAGVIGFFKHISHFAGPKLGIALIPITLMIFVIEIISELMKNVSLTLRLFGNIHGGHQAVEAMNALGKDVYIPIGAFLLPIKLLTCVVQAMIFTLLTCVYISLVTHHDEEHGHDHADDHSGDAVPAPAH